MDEAFWERWSRSQVRQAKFLQWVCGLLAVVLPTFVALFWLLDLPGSSKGRWADVVISLVLAATTVFCIFGVLYARTKLKFWRDRGYE